MGSGDIAFLESFVWGSSPGQIDRVMPGVPAVPHPTADALVYYLCVFELPSTLVCYFRGRELARVNVDFFAERPDDAIISRHFRRIRATLEEQYGAGKQLTLRRTGPAQSEQTAMLYWVISTGVMMLSMGLLSDGLPSSVPSLGLGMADPERDPPAAQLAAMPT